VAELNLFYRPQFLLLVKWCCRTSVFHVRTIIKQQYVHKKDIYKRKRENINKMLGHIQEEVPLVVNTSRSFPHSRLITGFVTRLTRRVQLVEQELLNLPEHLSSSPVFSGVRSYSIFSFIYMFCRSLFVLLYFFLWSLCCLFFDIRILIAPLVSSNSSWNTDIP
jgi:hypothetical protein